MNGIKRMMADTARMSSNRPACVKQNENAKNFAATGERESPATVAGASNAMKG